MEALSLLRPSFWGGWYPFPNSAELGYEDFDHVKRLKKLKLDGLVHLPLRSLGERLGQSIATAAPHSEGRGK